jgi:hypothetical protein
MVLKIADRVLEATTTTGTSNFSLAGAVDGYITFAAGVGNGNTCYYAAVHSDLGSYDEWEVGIGTVGGGGLTRNTHPIASSNGGAKVDFSVGTKHVFVTIPAIRTLFYDDDGRIFIGPSGENGSFEAGELLHIKGDVSASGISLDESLFLSGNSAAPSDTTARLYNVGGELFWAGSSISTSQGSKLFSVIAGPSGATETTYENFPVHTGSGIIFQSGPGIEIKISSHPDKDSGQPGQGSGILTFSATNDDHFLRIAVPSGEPGLAGSNQGRQFELRHGSGLIFEGERNLDVQFTHDGTGSGILTFFGPDLSSYVSAAASGIEIHNQAGTVYAVATTGTVATRGIVQLTNNITANDSLAVTPRAIWDAKYISKLDPVFRLGVSGYPSEGLFESVFSASGIMLREGDNISLEIDSTDNGSGVVTISSANTNTTYGAASGLVMDGDNIIRHEASAASSVNNSNPFFIQDITIDNFGHITAMSSSSVTIPEVSTSLSLGSSGNQPDFELRDGSGIMFIGGAGITIGVEDGENNNAATNRKGSGVITIDHNNTSSQASVNNAGNTFIQDVTLDEFGHVTALTSASVSASATNVNTDGTPTAVASGGIPIFQDADSIHFDPKLTWASGDIGLTQGVLGVDGYFNLHQVSAPSTTTDKLYNVGGSLIWNGTNISAGIGAGAITSDGPVTPKASGIPFFSSANEVGYDERLVFASGNAISAKLGITAGSDRENNFPHSTLHADGSFATRLRHVRLNNQEAKDTDSIISLDNRHIAGNMTFHLPQAKECMGRTYTIIRDTDDDANGSGIFVSASGTDLIDGKSTEDLWIDGDILTVIASSGLQNMSYGWKSINKQYSPHSVRFALRPSGMTPRTNPGSIVNYHPVGGADYVNYAWNAAHFMTFEGTDYARPGIAASGNHIGVGDSYLGSGLAQNFTALRDGYYNVDAHFESKQQYSPDNHSFAFAIIKYPLSNTRLSATPTALATTVALLELISISSRANSNDGKSFWYEVRTNQGGSTAGVYFRENISQTVRMAKDDRLIFLMLPRNRSGSFHLGHGGDGNFMDKDYFKLRASHTHITVTEIR